MTSLLSGRKTIGMLKGITVTNAGDLQLSARFQMFKFYQCFKDTFYPQMYRISSLQQLIL